MQVALQIQIEREKRKRKEQQEGAVSVLTASRPVFRGDNLKVQDYIGEQGAEGVGEFILSGPAETGKTWATLWRLDTLLRETPRAQAVLARKLQVSIWGTVLVTYKRIQELRAALGEEEAKPYGGEKPEFYDYPNGARLWIGGMDNPNKILSGERDFIYINQAEELGLNDWEILTTRCTGRGARTRTPLIFGDCNPGTEDHWILKREQIRVFYSRHEDNPSLFDESGELTAQGLRTMATLNALTGVRKKRLRYGLWVGTEGLYFELWDDDLHTCDPFPIPADWPIWASFDYGFAHNTAFGLFTEDNDGTVYLIAEHVRHKWLPPQHCAAIWRQVEKAGIARSRLKVAYAGHDVFQSKGDENGRSIAQQYASSKDVATGEPNGLAMDYASISRVPGALELSRRLGNVEVGIPPTLKLFRTCTRTIGAMARMVADPRDAEDVKKVDSDLNGDGGDDAYDMLRYGVMVKFKAAPAISTGAAPTAPTAQTDAARTRELLEAMKARTGAR